MLVPIVVALVVVAFLVALAWALRNRTVAETAKERRLQSDESSTLTYLVPPGQDPAVLVAALEKQGFDAAADVVGGPQRLLVGARTGRPDREEVRSVIEGASWTTIDHAKPVDREPVRFVDETR
jgi:hypothetical protein